MPKHETFDEFLKYKNILFQAVHYQMKLEHLMSVDFASNKYLASRTDYMYFRKCWAKPFGDYLKMKYKAKDEQSAFTSKAQADLAVLLKLDSPDKITKSVFHKMYRMPMGQIIHTGEQMQAQSEKNIQQPTPEKKYMNKTAITLSMTALFALGFMINSIASKTKSQENEPVKQEQRAPKNAAAVQAQAVPVNVRDQKTASNEDDIIFVVDTEHTKAPEWLKANRPVEGKWRAMREPNKRNTTVKDAMPRLMTTEFDYIYNTMSDNNNTIQQVADDFYAQRRLNLFDPKINVINPETYKTETLHVMSIYMPSVIQEVNNYVQNMRDVLSPLTQKEQLAAMRAFGPSIGFAVTKQQEWLSQHPQEARQAAFVIRQTAQDQMIKNNANTKNLSTVIAYTLAATESYRSTKSSDNQGLLLVADRVIRDLGKVSIKDLKRQQERSVQSKNNETPAPGDKREYPWKDIALWTALLGAAAWAYYEANKFFYGSGR